MPLVSILPELKKAQANGYALPCFDTFEQLGTEGMFQAIEEKHAPCLVAIYAGGVERPNANAFVSLVRALAKNGSTPISLILDHGGTFDQCMKALKLGFSDVMYDGSKLPIEENIATTKAIVRVAHAMGACVEAEIGHVGVGSNYDEFGGQGKGFTNPADVERFVAETGVDFLAVAIGTAHGVYKGEPKIDLELLDKIRERVSLPLVLHGGSGLSEAQFRGAIAHSISKVNIFTDLGMTAGAMMREAAAKGDSSYFSITGAAREAFHVRCGYYLDLFGATGKA